MSCHDSPGGLAVEGGDVLLESGERVLTPQAVWERLYRFFLYRGLNREDAADASQEILTRILPRWQRIRPESRLPYAYRAAHNLLADLRRERPTIPLPDDLPSSSQEMEVGQVSWALGQIPYLQALVIELRIIEGYTVRETAKLTGRSEAAVKSLQYRGVANLRRLLEEDR